MKEKQATKVVTMQTEIGKAVAPYISEIFNIPFISNVDSVLVKDEKIKYTRPAYSGKLIETVQMKNTPLILTIRPKSWELPERVDKAEGTFFLRQVEMTASRFPFLHFVNNKVNTTALTESKIVIGAGRGVKDEKGFLLIKELAEAIGGAVGISRGAVELGVSDNSIQIGQTGKSIAPDIYIACGISGAIQHMVGVEKAKTIIAINEDPEAPIFELADYCIVGNLFEILPLLIESIKQERIRS